MRKRNKMLLFVVVGIMAILVMAFRARSNTEIQLSEQGKYNKLAFNADYVTHLVKDSEKVLYEVDGCYLLGEKSQTNIGTSYFFVQLDTDTWRDPVVLQVSSKYLVFSVKHANNSSKREKIAVEIKETRANFDDRIVHRSIPYEELSIWDKWELHDVALQRTDVASIK